MIDRIRQYLQERMIFIDELAMPVLSSAGSHLVQLQQKKEPFYYVSGKNERVNLACVSLGPTGCSKTFVQDLVINLTDIPHSKMAMLTSAGLLGSKDESGKIHEGLSKQLTEGILIVNELSSLVAEKQKEETQLLLNNVLEILSEGKVEKRLGTVHFNFKTDMSLWGCVQLSNKRFDFTGGLARRAQFIFKSWTVKDLKKVVKARRNFRSVKEDEVVKNEVKSFIKEREIKEIEWDEKLLKWIERRSYTANNQVKLEKAAIGLSYWYPYNPGSKVLQVRKDRMMIEHLETVERMWRNICTDPEVSLAQSIIGNKGIKKDKFFVIFGDLGYTRLNTADLLRRIEIGGLIKYEGDKIKRRDLDDCFIK